MEYLEFLYFFLISPATSLAKLPFSLKRAIKITPISSPFLQIVILWYIVHTQCDVLKMEIRSYYFLLKILQWTDLLLGWWETRGHRNILQIRPIYSLMHCSLTKWRQCLGDLILETVPCALEKNVYSADGGWSVLYMSVGFNLLCKSSVSLLTFCPMFYPLFKVRYWSLILLQSCLFLSSILSMFASYI